MTAGLVGGLGLFLVGVVVTFVRSTVRGRVLGVAVMAAGGVLTLAAVAPEPAWIVTATVAVTLAPLVLVAVGLWRRLEHGDTVTLDDEPR